MTMRIVVLKPEEGLDAGTEYFIDRTKALRMIEEGKATTPDLYQKIVKKKAEETAKLKAEADAKKKAEAEKKKREEAEAKRKAEAAAAEKKKKEENATSKRTTSRRKAVKR